MKLSTIAWVLGGFYLISKLRPMAEWQQYDELRDQSAALINSISPDRLWGLYDSVNYYADLAGSRNMNTDLIPVAGYAVSGNMIQVTDRRGVMMQMPYEEWAHYVNTNTKQIASATGDWSCYMGD